MPFGATPQWPKDLLLGLICYRIHRLSMMPSWGSAFNTQALGATFMIQTVAVLHVTAGGHAPGEGKERKWLHTPGSSLTTSYFWLMWSHGRSALYTRDLWFNCEGGWKKKESPILWPVGTRKSLVLMIAFSVLFILNCLINRREYWPPIFQCILT